MINIYPSLSSPWWWVTDLIWLGFVAAALVSIIKFVPPAWRVLTRFVRTINALADLPQALEDQRTFRNDMTQSMAAQDQKIAEIHHETHENNGSSIKDSTHRIELRLARVEKGVKGLYTREEIDAKNAAFADQLEQTRPPIKRPTRKWPVKPKE